MINITFSNNQVHKILNAEENTASKTLTIQYPDSYSTEELNAFYSQKNIKDLLAEIVKTSETGDVLRVYNHFTFIKQEPAISKEEIMKEVKREVKTLDENGNEITTTVIETISAVEDTIMVILKYEEPNTVLLSKLNAQLNPTLDIEKCTIDELKAYKQSLNKEAFSDFLLCHPLLWTDEKYYGVTQADQIEMQTDLNAYKLKQELGFKDWPLEWHDIKKACREFSLSDFTSLLNAIIDFVYPYRKLQESYKQKIYDVSTKEEILSVKCIYELLE